MQEPNGRRRARARGWPYVVTGVLFAGICAWISYNDGLFVARLAGNHDALAYFYPLLPDGLIILSLLALAEAARADVKRSRWAMAGLVLGIALTLAMNTYAGVEHSALDAVLDGMVPVVFFIAVEIVLWHVRRGRAPAAPETADPEPSRSVPSTVFEAARVSMKATAAAGNSLSRNQLQNRFGLSRSEADEIWREFAPQERSRDGAPPQGLPRAVPAAQEPPAGMPPRVPAGGPGRSRDSGFLGPGRAGGPAAEVPAGATARSPAGASQNGSAHA